MFEELWEKSIGIWASLYLCCFHLLEKKHAVFSLANGQESRGGDGNDDVMKQKECFYRG